MLAFYKLYLQHAYTTTLAYTKIHIANQLLIIIIFKKDKQKTNEQKNNLQLLAAIYQQLSFCTALPIIY